MKKYIAAFAAVCILFLNINCYLAAENIDITIESKTAQQGETVDINIELTNNRGILAMLFELTYDTNRLKLIGAKDSGLVPGSMFSQTTEKYPYIMLWNSASYENYTDNGTLAALSFEVLEDAPEGDAFIKLEYSKDDVYDVDLNEVSVNVHDGNINVAAPPDSTENINTSTITPAPAAAGQTRRSGGGSSGTRPKVTSTPAPTETPTPAPTETPMPDIYYSPLPTNSPGADSANAIILQVGNLGATVYGRKVYNDVAPIIVNDRTMVPIRFIAESFGANVEWDEDGRRVLIKQDNSTIILKIGSADAYINDGEMELDSPAFIENERTYVPIRFIAEGLGASVDWIEGTQEIIIVR